MSGKPRLKKTNVFLKGVANYVTYLGSNQSEKVTTVSTWMWLFLREVLGTDIIWCRLRGQWQIRTWRPQYENFCFAGYLRNLTVTRET